jgi:hypothetical protein
VRISSRGGTIGGARKNQDIHEYTADSPGSMNRQSVQDLYSSSGEHHRRRAVIGGEREGVPHGMHQPPTIGHRDKVRVCGKIVSSNILCMHHV